MDFTENKEVILKKLAYLKDRLQLKRIFFTCIGPSTPPRATNIPILRVNILMSGAKLITLPLKTGASSVQFRTGDIQCSIPDSWELQSWDTDHELLCIVARTDYLRVSYYIVKKGYVSNTFYHTDRPYGESLRSAFHSLLSLCREDDLESAMPLVKAIIIMAHKEVSSAGKRTGNKMEYTFRQVARYLENALDEDIDRTSVARKFNLNSSYLSQLFTRMCGRSFHGYLTERRMELARHLLENSDLSVKQISVQCGFRSYVHFVRRFRELVKLSPGRYRGNHRR